MTTETIEAPEETAVLPERIDFATIVPPVGAYPCRGCRATIDRPGLCGPCGLAYDHREHDRTLGAALESIPERFRWATLASILAERTERGEPRVKLPPKALATADRLLANRVVVLHGASGAGKTSLACALLRAVIDAGRLGAPEHAQSTARRARFFAARTLGAPHRERDGLPPAEQVARASVAVIDDVGQEAGIGAGYKATDATKAVADILAERHDSGARTIVTTYLGPEEWPRLYGDGIARRFWGGDGVRVVRVGGGT